MNDASGPIPGCPPIPFHIAIEGEHLSAGTESEVIRIAEPRQEQFPFPALWISPENMSAGSQDTHGMAAGVPLPGQQQVFLIIFVR